MGFFTGNLNHTRVEIHIISTYCTSHGKAFIGLLQCIPIFRHNKHIQSGASLKKSLVVELNTVSGAKQLTAYDMKIIIYTNRGHDTSFMIFQLIYKLESHTYSPKN